MRIEIQDLTKKYGDFKLSIPHLEVLPGETVGLVGNNGAGKTTFLRLLLDLIKADGGFVTVNGTRVDKDTVWKSTVGSYLDESFLIDFLTPAEYFSFVGNVYQLDAAQIDTSLARFELFLPDEALRRNQPFIRTLSLGNKKKIGLVAAMLPDPKLLILDEPFANLDPGSQIRLKGLLRQLHQQHGTTMLISSHDLGHVTEVCQRVTVLKNGQIVRNMTTSTATLNELEAFFSVVDG